MAVKYQVERRPINGNGKVFRGSGYGDYITVLTHPHNLKTPGLIENISSLSPTKIVPPGLAIPELGTQSPALSHVQELNGEPWLVHSTHFSVESALESAAPLAGAIGKENVRIVKVLSHTTVFKLN